ncbi:Clan CD, family C14, metacaspase-like cysteine peptidase [Histomonas meleagridis]|uniref:Clan CD, family C14, metacaspase-like cysteine peptidase n=1 Tax=Histomonas meleagridis TaxID=135588 RepID=UPI0035596606|nr:Clan CD, family C14, metacaspase-like cysteine peptidase [Histomonas meleagridis]KAH0796720.1 Clan CD, family C14, metacaspase-like cysteine peptidase [Histomonas meleagridis]
MYPYGQYYGGQPQYGQMGYQYSAPYGYPAQPQYPQYDYSQQNQYQMYQQPQQMGYAPPNQSQQMGYPQPNQSQQTGYQQQMNYQQQNQALQMNYQQQSQSQSSNQVPQLNYPQLNYPQLDPLPQANSTQPSAPSAPTLNYPSLDEIMMNYQPPANPIYPQIQTPYMYHQIQSIPLKEVRKHKTIESALSQLNELATNLDSYDPKNVRQMNNACLICVNTYNKPNLQLGVGPINDSIITASFHRYMGYEVYYLHNTKPNTFMNFLKQFLRLTICNLTVYYTGHGSNIKDTNGDEDDGYDEVMVFDDGYIVDDDLAICLKENCNGAARIILLTDCCHSGTIWDIPENIRNAIAFPPNIIAISSAADNQTSKQATINEIEQGLFTHHFWKFLKENPRLTSNEMEVKINDKLHKYNQKYCATPTRAGLTNTPIFPLLQEVMQ